MAGTKLGLAPAINHTTHSQNSGRGLERQSADAARSVHLLAGSQVGDRIAGALEEPIHPQAARELARVAVAVPGRPEPEFVASEADPCLDLRDPREVWVARLPFGQDRRQRRIVRRTGHVVIRRSADDDVVTRTTRDRVVSRPTDENA